MSIRDIPAGEWPAAQWTASGRRAAVLGTGGARWRYPDVCANCGEPVIGERIGVLATGDVYSWVHRDFRFGCGGRVDRFAPQALPVAEVDAACTVHGRVTVHHACEQGGEMR